MFLQPSFFEAGKEAILQTTERKYDVHLPYGWTEQDEVVFELPEGFKLEQLEPPVNLDFGNAGRYTTLLLAKDGKLTYRRELVFGDNGLMLFPPKSYAKVKRAFDAVHGKDSRVIALRSDSGQAVGLQNQP